MKNEKLLKMLLDLPNKILHNEDLAELSQIILHELAHEQHLGLKKATFLIDNPEFGCMKGIAGFCKDECKHHKEDLWHEPHTFSNDMKKAAFHEKIKNFSHESMCNDDNCSECKNLQNLGKKIGIDNPSVYVWDMRNGNKGILIFEEDNNHGKYKDDKDLLEKTAALLGLCRIY